MARSDPRNRSNTWNSNRVPHLGFLHADFTTQAFSPHFHEAIVVAVTEHGGAKIRSRGVVEDATRSRLLVFNPGEPHSGHMGGSERWHYRGFYLPQRAMALLKSELQIQCLPLFMHNVINDDEIIDQFIALHKMFEAADEEAALECLVDAFGRLFERHAERSKGRSAPRGDKIKFMTARNAMLERFRGEIPLSDLAQELGISTFQLIGLFKRHAGMTPHAFLTQVRLHNACRCLRRGLPIVDAALDNGFYDQSALSKHFKRSYGITPLQYMKATAAPLEQAKVATQGNAYA